MNEPEATHDVAMMLKEIEGHLRSEWDSYAGIYDILKKYKDKGMGQREMYTSLEVPYEKFRCHDDDKEDDDPQKKSLCAGFGVALDLAWGFRPGLWESSLSDDPSFRMNEKRDNDM